MREFVQFLSILKNDGNLIIEHNMIAYLADREPLLGSYPNGRITFKMYLSIPATKCEGDRFMQLYAQNL